MHGIDVQEGYAVSGDGSRVFLADGSYVYFVAKSVLVDLDGLVGLLDDWRSASWTSSRSCDVGGPGAKRFGGVLERERMGVQTTPIQVALPANALAGVSCASSTACTAVGPYENSLGA